MTRAHGACEGQDTPLMHLCMSGANGLGSVFRVWGIGWSPRHHVPALAPLLLFATRRRVASYTKGVFHDRNASKNTIVCRYADEATWGVQHIEVTVEANL